MRHSFGLCGLLAGVILLSGCVAAGTTSTPAPARERVRHEDPAAAAVDPDPTELFVWYLDSARLLSTWRFREGRLRVQRLKLATLPPEMESLVGDLGRLLLKEGSILEAADGWFRDAARLMAAGRSAEAGRLLAQMSAYLRRGDVLFSDIADAVEDLARRTRIRELPPDSPQRQAYEELLRVAARVRALLTASRTAAIDTASAAAFAGLLPIETRLEIDDPGPAYPGRRLTIRGRAAEQAPIPSGRAVRLWLDGVLIGQFPLGPFSASLDLSPAMLPGAHALVARVEAQGRYLGAEARRMVTVTRLAPAVRLETPRYGLAPGLLTLRGEATSQLGRVGGGTIAARLGPALREGSTDREGRFSLGLAVPPDLNLVGLETVTVDVRPREPWHAPAGTLGRVFIINLVSLALASFLLPALGAVYVLRRSMGAGRVEETRPPDVVTVLAPSRAEPPRLTVSGPARTVVQFYVEAQYLIARASGIAIEPEMTMREFLRHSRAVVPSAAFEELTHLAERAVYSAHRPGEAAHRRAAELLERVREDAAHGHG